MSKKSCLVSCVLFCTALLLSGIFPGNMVSECHSEDLFTNGEWVDNSHEVLHYKSEPKNDRKKRSGAVNINISQLDASAFPEIRVLAQINDQNGSTIENLDETHFTAHEFKLDANGNTYDGQEEIITVNYLSLESGGEITIALVMDSSGSMSGIDMNGNQVIFPAPIVDARKAAKDFISKMKSLDRAAIVDFDDDVNIWQSFTSDKQALISGVDKVDAEGSTQLYDGCYEALAQITAETGVKAVIAFTDGNTFDDIHSQEEVIAYANQLNVPIYTIGIGGVDDGPLKALAENTGGYYQAGGSASELQQIYDDIAGIIKGQYEILYRTHNDQQDGTERKVEVEVTVNSDSDMDWDTYGASSIPIIMRTQETLALEMSSQPDDQDMTISAIITDDVEVTEARLFYRTSSVSGSSYNQVEMTNSSGDVWEYTIPADEVSGPGLDYYITASDGANTKSAPENNPASNPYQIAVMPNYPPIIVHFPVTGATEGEPIEISAYVTDVTYAVDSVTLYYKSAGVFSIFSGYKEVEMELSGLPSIGNWKAEIPAEDVTLPGIKYFIKATDNFGISSFDGTDSDPHFIDLEKVFTIKVFARDKQKDPVPIENASVYKKPSVIVEIFYENNIPMITLKNDKGTYLGSTDENGILEVQGNIELLDKLYVEAHIADRKAVKDDHDSDFLEGNMYEVWMTSNRIGENGYDIPYVVTDLSNDIEIELVHPIFKVNLLVAIEWDVPDDSDFIENLEKGMRKASNYLYDVTDGQVMFNKIEIYDDRLNPEHQSYWKNADILIYAANYLWKDKSDLYDGSRWPKAYTSGLVRGQYTEKETGDLLDMYIMMPRVFNHNSLSWDNRSTYTTVVHEFGHYAFAFFDEYMNYKGTKHKKLNVTTDYGLMDSQNPGDISEMSGNYHYKPISEYSDEELDWQNENSILTKQYQVWRTSCWGHLSGEHDHDEDQKKKVKEHMEDWDLWEEGLFQKNYLHGSKGAKVYVAFVTPDTDTKANQDDSSAPYWKLPEKLDYLDEDGDGDGLTGLDESRKGPHLNVGRLMDFDSHNSTSPKAFHVNVKAKGWGWFGSAKKGAKIKLLRNGDRNNSIVQGIVPKDGKLTILGAHPGDIIEVQDNKKVGRATVIEGETDYTVDDFSKPRKRRSDVENYMVKTGLTSIDSSNTLTITVCPDASFSSSPDVEISLGQSSDADFVPVSMDKMDGTDNYVGTVEIGNYSSGTIQVRADDDGLASSHPFTISQLDADSEITVYSNDTMVSINFDSGTVSSAGYVVVTTDEYCEYYSDSMYLVTNTYDITISDSPVTINKNLSLIFEYRQDMLDGMDETSLQIYRYNETSSLWEVVGGTVDTLNNTVQVEIDTLSTFGVFGSESSDSTAPAAITDFTASTSDAAWGIDFSWTATGDDGDSGTATNYIIKHNAVPIDESNWEDSYLVITSSMLPKTSGRSETLTLSMGDPAKEYYFAIRAVDEAGNMSPVSNSPKALSNFHDGDNDGMPDSWELTYGLNTSINDARYDLDLDGLHNEDEYEKKTDPSTKDTDGDELMDGEEVHVYGSDPAVYDTDEGGQGDGLEVKAGTDPAEASDDILDLDGNGKVDIKDIMIISSRWGNHPWDVTYRPRFDFDKNGEIDVADIMKVAAQWGK